MKQLSEILLEKLKINRNINIDKEPAVDRIIL